MPSWPFRIPTIATLFCLSFAARAAIPSSCASASDPVGSCSKPLEDVTTVTAGEFIVAKLQCYGCPTTEQLQWGHHIITHEENALLFNVSLSRSRSELLLNDIPIFPSLSSPPPRIYAAQVPLNFSVSSLISTIDCTHRPCKNFDGKCSCIPDADTLGGMGLSYDYVTIPTTKQDEFPQTWMVHFDAIGGNNGYVGDPVAKFNDTRQRILVVSVLLGREGRLDLIGARLDEREQQPRPEPPKTLWGTLLRFLGMHNSERKKSGHVIHLQNEWDGYGRIGTLKHMLRDLWGEWPWLLITVIVGSVLGGLGSLYGMYRFIVACYEVSSRVGADDKYEQVETEGLLSGEEITEEP